MNRSLTFRLILKDLRMAWPFPAFAIVTGCGAAGLYYFANGPLAVAGIVAFFVVLILLGTIAQPLIINERKKQTLAFVMSLPVSARQYGVAKLTAALGMYLVPWLMLGALGLAVIVSRSDVPNGVIPLAVLLMPLPLIGFLSTMSVAIVSESETRAIVTMAAVNVSYSFVWVGIMMSPGLTRDVQSPVPIWNEAVLSVLGVEAALIVAIVAATLYLQARKRDFVR